MAALKHTKAYSFLKFKFYFDKGFSLLNYVKYPLAALGLFSRDAQFIIITFIVYALACLVTGYIWLKLKWQDIENDIQNSYNPFVKDTLKGLSNAKRFQRKI